MSEPIFNPVSFVKINPLQAGQRIDNFLLKHLKNVPKSHIYRLLRKGQVRVNKGRVKPVYKLQTGDTLRIPPLQLELKEPLSVSSNSSRLQQLARAILYEDQQLLVLNKPAGMAVHGGSGINFGVIEGLRALYPQAPYLELVHRLDRDTSGCLLIAKKPACLKQLHQALREQQVGKYYAALIKGNWEAHLAQINAPLLKNVVKSGERIVRVDAEGKSALSRFKLQQRFTQSCLVQVKLDTGRTHQIRVHAAHTEHPIAGDSKYGDEAFNQEMRDLGLKRLFLHAETLHIPALGEQSAQHFQAPLPEELKQVLVKLSPI